MNPKIVVIGSANMDLVLPVARLPRAGETIAGGDLKLIPGGKGANQACAAARLGGRVSMLGCIGEDSFGDALISSLSAAGVDTALMGRTPRPTGCASIYVMPDGENSIVISAGANADVTPEYAPSSLRAAGRPAYVLAQLEVPLATVEAAFAEARSAGAVTILDPAPARPLEASLLRQVDILTPNQTEAAALLGRPGHEIADFASAAHAARELRRLGPAMVVLKLGALGCFLDSGQAAGPVPGFAVPAVDTTAAGDVFNGAFAVALSEGKPPFVAAAFACAASAISVTRPGAQSSIPSRSEVEDFLACAPAAAR